MTTMTYLVLLGKLFSLMNKNFEVDIGILVMCRDHELDHLGYCLLI
jgi:hypothetical protein